MSSLLLFNRYAQLQTSNWECHLILKKRMEVYIDDSMSSE